MASFTDYTKKKKKQSAGGVSFTDYTKQVLGKDDIEAPTYKTYKVSQDDDIAPVKSTQKNDTRKWFEKGAFEDGYQFGDVTKTILGTGGDIGRNLIKGVAGMPEKAWDALVTATANDTNRKLEQTNNMFKLLGIEEVTFSDKQLSEMKKANSQFATQHVAKDLYDEGKVARKIMEFTPNYQLRKALGEENEEDFSVLGEKSDALVQSAGQLGATAALQAVGVPWWLTTGVTSYGAEAENALREGATLEEANTSALISAGAEILTEKISGGINFGGATLDDVLTKELARGISDKAVRTLAKLGIDAVGEGFEEVLSGVMSAIGQKLTYADDKEMSELFSSEEAFESFIGGAVLGGGMGLVNTYKADKKGVDYASGLTNNEKSVVDKVYQDTIAEQEKNGKKLTQREKSKIYDDVLDQMEKGYISTDTIEEVLGGETYKSYRDTVDGEEALQKEFDTLNQMKQGEMTGEQIDRRAELKNQLAELKENSNKDNLKTQLNDEVLGLIKGSRLVESYNEKARRGNAYEADLSQYEEKYQGTIKKAVESGILNDTRRTHEFVDMIAKISADKGVFFDFANNDKIAKSSFAVEGKTVNGYVDGDGKIVLNIDSPKALESTTGHEITHILEGTELYDTFANTITEYAKSKGDYNGRLETLNKLYEGVYEGEDFAKKVNKELVADLVGDYVFTDKDFIRKLSTENRNIFEKIYDEIKYLCKVATAGSKEARELEKVKKAFAEVYRESGKASKNTATDTAYSLSDSEGTKLSKEQQDFFKDSKMRDENGSLKVMYHGSQDAGFHVFDPKMSDDDTSFFFVDRNDVAASYSGTTETYEAQPIRTAEDMNNFLAKIGYDHYKAVEKNGKFELLENNEHVAYSDTAQGIYEEFCWYEGVGDGDANYRVYLNLKNPLVVDAKGQNWNNISREFSQDVADRYNSLTAEEKAALVDLAEWGEYSVFRDEMLEARATAEQGGSGVFDEAYTKTLARAYEKLGGANANLYDAFSIASDNFSANSIQEFAVKQMNTRDYAKKAKAQGYDGVIFNNIHDNGGYSNGSEGASTVAIAFNSNQIKSVANKKPTIDPDIRYSLSQDSNGNKLTDEQKQYFKDSKAVDENGNLKIVYHGTRNADFTVFKRNITYFTDNKSMADSYSPNGSMFEGYVNITKPYVIDAAGEKWSAIPIDEATKQFLQGYGASVFKEGGKWRTTPADIASVIEEAVDNGELDYDGIIIKNIDDTGSYYKGEEKHLGTDYIVFNSNQFKNANNKTPTKDADIRFSLSPETDTEYMSAVKKGDTETVQRLVDEAARNSMPNSKVRDESGNLLTVYHGSPSKFTVFKHSKMNTHGNAHGRGFYFTEDKNMAEGYEKDNGQLLKGYLNIEKPLSEDKVTIKRPDLVKLIKATCKGEAQSLVEDGGYDSIREAILDTWVSNYIDTYNTNINDVYKEVANIIYSGNDNDVDIIAEITNGGAGTENTLVNTHKVLGYDGVIYTNDFGTHEFVSLVSNQFKSTEPITYDDKGNVIPLSERFNLNNEDIRYSLSEQGEAPIKQNNLTYGEDVKLETAPIKEATPEVEAAEDILPDDYAPITEEEAITMNRERLESLTEADIPLETAEEYNSLPDTSKLDDVALETISAALKNTLSLNNKETKAIQGVIQKYSTTEFPSKEELFEEIKDNFGEKVWTETDEEIAEVKATLRKYRIDVSKVVKSNFTEYVQFMRSHFNKIKFAKDGASVDQAYLELSEMYPSFFPADIYNPADQLERIAEVADMDSNIENSIMLDDETIQEAVDIISDGVNTYKQIALQEEAESIGNTFTDDFAPVIKAETQQKYEAIKPKPKKEPKLIRVKDAEAEQHTAKILTEEPTTKKKKRGLWSFFKEYVLDKGMVFEGLAKKTKNRELEAKWNFIRYADGNAQSLIGKGKGNVKALKDIQADVEKAGLTDQLYNYLYHKHNVDRMTLAERFDNVENKAVFGNDVTAEMSKRAVEQLEKAHPELRTYANDIYNYNKYLRNMLVEGGVISQETANLWETMYPHYVPIRRVGDSGLNINVALDTNKTGVNAPIKRATGGNRDILPLFDTMAQRTVQTYKAVAKNSFGVELKNTLGTTIENTATSLDEVIESIDTHEELLKKGENGNNPTFTVFENGEKVTFEITDEMYGALKPKGEILAYRNKFLSGVSNIQRGLLTEYNPVFMLTNAVKDVQDVLINSQHAVKTYANFPKAIGEMLSKGKYYTEYMENGGGQNSYFDNDTNTFVEERKGIKKIVGMPLDIISGANNIIERLPRLAEYIASRKSGRSIEVSMLDAARVTTNFAAGGDVTKFLNTNGCTFLSASVNGAVQQARNIQEAKINGLKGWVGLAAKFAVAGLPAMLLNSLLWDDDEDYAELSDYVKDNYYVIAKYGDGQFVRIPKGRALAVIQNAMEQIKNAATGEDEVDLKNFLELAVSNLAPNNPLDSNIFAPIMQVVSNKTWYGEDLVPTRLQDLPKSEQYDESTDAISKWLGEKQNVLSPYQINYMLNQYSGGVGDVVLPMLTPEAERGDNSNYGNFIAPLKDKFSTDSVMNNQNVSDFYSKVDELTTNAKSSIATDEDILKYKYMNSENAELGDLYARKREIQNSDLTDAEKYSQVRKIQEQINTLAEDSLSSYENVNIQGKYATVGDLHYRWYEPSETSDAEAGWQKISGKQLEKQEKVTSGLGISASDYWRNKEEYDYAYEYPEKYSLSKVVGGYETYKAYTSELYDIKADKDKNGKSISGSRKEKVLDYVNNLDAEYGEKIILFKSQYNADDTYNYEIIDYLNSRDDISYEEMEVILKELGFTVKADGTIQW